MSGQEEVIPHLQTSREVSTVEKLIPCRKCLQMALGGLLTRQTGPYAVRVEIMVGKRENLAICVPEVLCEESDRKLLLFLNALGLCD